MAVLALASIEIFVGTHLPRKGHYPLPAVESGAGITRRFLHVRPRAVSRGCEEGTSTVPT